MSSVLTTNLGPAFVAVGIYGLPDTWYLVGQPESLSESSGGNFYFDIQDFQSGWTAGTGETVTRTQGIVVPEWGTNEAVRLRGDGEGSTTTKLEGRDEAVADARVTGAVYVRNDHDYLYDNKNFGDANGWVYDQPVDVNLNTNPPPEWNTGRAWEISGGGGSGAQLHSDVNNDIVSGDTLEVSVHVQNLGSPQSNDIGSDFETNWAANDGETVTIQQGIAVPEWGTNNATLIAGDTQGTSTIKYGTTVAPATEDFIWGMHAKNISDTPVIISAAGTGMYMIQPGESVIADDLVTTGGSVAGSLNFSVQDPADRLAVVAWRPFVRPNVVPITVEMDSGLVMGTVQPGEIVKLEDTFTANGPTSMVFTKPGLPAGNEMDIIAFDPYYTSPEHGTVTVRETATDAQQSVAPGEITRVQLLPQDITGTTSLAFSMPNVFDAMNIVAFDPELNVFVASPFQYGVACLDGLLPSVEIAIEGDEPSVSKSTSGVRYGPVVHHASQYTVTLMTNIATAWSLWTLCSGMRERQGFSSDLDPPIYDSAYASPASSPHLDAAHGHLGMVVIPLRHRADSLSGEDPHDWWFASVYPSARTSVSLKNNTGIDAQENFTFVLKAKARATSPGGNPIPSDKMIGTQMTRNEAIAVYGAAPSISDMLPDFYL